MRRLPPLRALEAFVRIVRLGSARAAANELGLSPSALSRRVTNLEEFAGKKLFSRSQQSMKLTDEGRNFYDAVAPHLEALAVAAGCFAAVWHAAIVSQVAGFAPQISPSPYRHRYRI